MNRTSQKETLNDAHWEPKPISKEAFNRIMAASRKREKWLKKAHTLSEKHLNLRITV